jgi:lysophospholipase L1-like esterase/peptidoglycan hydrolase-like protein with peptidoglycan-binding domain
MIGNKHILVEQALIPLNVLFIGDSQLASPDSFGKDLIRDKVVKGRVVAKVGASTSLMYKFLRDSYDPKYNVVVIMGGGNDSKNPNANTAIRNLTSMYQLAQSGGSVVIAVTNPTKDFTPNPNEYPSNEEIAKWVRLQNISNFTIDANDITHNKGYFSKDLVHLNNAGHEAIYDAILPVLQEIAKGETEQDDAILKYQNDLEKLGFNLGNESSTGVAGKKTKRAIEKLEKVYNSQEKSQSVSNSAMNLMKKLIGSDVVSRILGKKIQEPKETAPLMGKSVTNPSAKIMTFLKNKGLSTSQAAGIVGNLQVESEFNPNAVGDNGTSYGIAQWHKSRFSQLKKWTAKNGLKWNTIDAQLQYLWWELNNSETDALSKLKMTNDPENAAYVFAKYYERPAEIADSRMKNAVDTYNEYTNNIIKRIA